MINYKEIISLVANSNNIDPGLAMKIYALYWRTIKSFIESCPLKEDINELEFCSIRPNISIPSLGKFYVLYPRYDSLKKKYKLFYNKYYAKD